MQPAGGGEPLCQVVLSNDMFAASAMQGEAVAFEEMKVKELRDELTIRGASRTGVKCVLQQRMHTLIVQEAAEAARAERAADGVDMDDD